MKSLCDIFGHQNLVRKYYERKDTWYCPKCKSKYDVELLETDVCPECKIKMRHPKSWDWQCLSCGYNV